MDLEGSSNIVVLSFSVEAASLGNDPQKVIGEVVYLTFEAYCPVIDRWKIND
jgi:hypothetical protein